MDYDKIFIDKGIYVQNYHYITILLRLEFLLDIAKYYNSTEVIDRLTSIIVLNNLNGDNNV